MGNGVVVVVWQWYCGCGCCVVAVAWQWYCGRGCDRGDVAVAMDLWLWYCGCGVVVLWLWCGNGIVAVVVVLWMWLWLWQWYCGCGCGIVDFKTQQCEQHGSNHLYNVQLDSQKRGACEILAGPDKLWLLQSLGLLLQPLELLLLQPESLQKPLS